MAPSDHPGPRRGRHRAPRPPRRGVLVTGLALSGLLIAGAFVRAALANSAHDVAVPAATASPAAEQESSAGQASARPSPVVPAPSEPVRPVAIPSARPGTFAYATGEGQVLGTAGPLRRFRVAVQSGTGQDVARFAATVDQVLGDPRSWIAGRTVRLKRVPEQASADFTIFLATGDTSEKMCRRGGLQTNGYTSCRLSGKVIINVMRWLRAVPGYGAPLATYQAYAINHEVGHELGHRHETCPGPGRPAPVMQQQTFGLHGCVANAWPYLAGRHYTGPPA